MQMNLYLFDKETMLDNTRRSSFALNAKVNIDARLVNKKQLQSKTFYLTAYDTAHRFSIHMKQNCLKL